MHCFARESSLILFVGYDQVTSVSDIRALSVLHYIPTANKTVYVNYFRYAGHSTAASDWIYSPASRWKRCALTSVMGGALSVTNRTENRIVVQLEQNPVAIRYWGYVEPGATNKVWEHAPADPLNQGFFIMRVIDVNSLPSTYQPPNMFLEQCKSAGFGLLGVPCAGSRRRQTRGWGFNSGFGCTT